MEKTFHLLQGIFKRFQNRRKASFKILCLTLRQRGLFKHKAFKSLRFAESNNLVDHKVTRVEARDLSFLEIPLNKRITLSKREPVRLRGSKESPTPVREAKAFYISCRCVSCCSIKIHTISLTHSFSSCHWSYQRSSEQPAPSMAREADTHKV